jgi:hypothetical protein
MFAIHITLSYVLHSKGFSGERRRHREGMNVGDGGGHEEGHSIGEGDKGRKIWGMDGRGKERGGK